MSDVGQRKKRLETDAWEKHRRVIEHLYLDQGQALDQVMGYMKTNYNFEATEQAYKKKLRRWKISKNIPAAAMEYILDQIDIRLAQGKESVVYWHDRPVDAEKIERSRQRLARDKKENPDRVPLNVPPSVFKLVRIETPPPMAEGGIQQQTLPLRLDIPHAPPPVSLYGAGVAGHNPVPTLTFTQWETPSGMMEPEPLSAVSANSSVSGFWPENDGSTIATTQLALSPVLGATDYDIDLLLGIDTDFEQLKMKLSMNNSSSEVQRALQKGNKLLQGGSALLPKNHLESMDISVKQNKEAMGEYRSILKQHSNGADASSIAEALRQISSLQANSTLPDTQTDASLADRERLLAGYHFMFGPDNPVYLRQVFDFCSLGRASSDRSALITQVSMFKNAITKMLSMDLEIDKTASILETAYSYHKTALLTQPELEYFFSSVVMHHPSPEWWVNSENIRFVAQAFMEQGLFDRAEQYLLIIMQQAHHHMLQGDFFQQDQYAFSLFDTLSHHICPPSSPTTRQYIDGLLSLESALRSTSAPLAFNALELTCWILLATAYSRGLKPANEIVYMLREAGLDTRPDKPLQVAWHSTDGVTRALFALGQGLKGMGQGEWGDWVSRLGADVAGRWAEPRLWV